MKGDELLWVEIADGAGCLGEEEEEDGQGNEGQVSGDFGNVLDAFDADEAGQNTPDDHEDLGRHIQVRLVQEEASNLEE